MKMKVLAEVVAFSVIVKSVDRRIGFPFSIFLLYLKLIDKNLQNFT